MELKVIVDDNEGGGTIEGIPPEAWARFKNAAKVQFPDAGDDAWARFLSEVIMAGAGGDDKFVTYFMTSVPLEYATALHSILNQVQFSWDKFHAYLLHSAAKQDNFRVVRFHDTDHMGTFLALGIDPVLYTKVQEATGKSFEIVMATFLAAAANGTLKFSPEATYLEPTAVGQ